VNKESSYLRIRTIVNTPRGSRGDVGETNCLDEFGRSIAGLP
jgi:hypothetical protein